MFTATYKLVNRCLEQQTNNFAQNGKPAVPLPEPAVCWRFLTFPAAWVQCALVIFVRGIIKYSCIVLYYQDITSLLSSQNQFYQVLPLRPVKKSSLYQKIIHRQIYSTMRSDPENVFNPERASKDLKGHGANKQIYCTYRVGIVGGWWGSTPYSLSTDLKLNLHCTPHGGVSNSLSCARVI